MPCYTAWGRKKGADTMSAIASGTSKTVQRPHAERHADKGFASDEFQATTHTAIPDSKID